MRQALLVFSWCWLSACGGPPDPDVDVPGEVEVRLSMEDGAAVRVTFTNVSPQPVRLLTWYVPGTDGVKAELFEVSREGLPVEYLGPHVKRRAPRAEDFVTLAPGEQLTGLAPLSAVYDLSEGGAYTVRYVAAPTGVPGVGLTRAAQLDSPALHAWLEGPGPRPPAREAQGVMDASGLAFIGCSSTRQAQLATARAEAQASARQATEQLAGSRSGSARYTSWFGTWSAARRDTARTHFAAIGEALDRAPLSLDCTCTDAGTYAYVYPGAPYRIYLCGAFWNAPPTGTDSRAGTLVHELSHFRVVAGTRDHAYGQSAARALARSHPARALDNADSHEYFAENSPAQD